MPSPVWVRAFVGASSLAGAGVSAYVFVRAVHHMLYGAAWGINPSTLLIVSAGGLFAYLPSRLFGYRLVRTE